MEQTFESVLSSFKIFSEPWIVVSIPPHVSEALGVKGRMDVSVIMNGSNFQRTLLSDGAGCYFFVTNLAMRKKIRKNEGDSVQVTIKPDSTYALVELPDYFEAELMDFPLAKLGYEKSPPSGKRWIAQFLNEAKSMETKANRVIKAIDVLEKWARQKKLKV